MFDNFSVYVLNTSRYMFANFSVYVGKLHSIYSTPPPNTSEYPTSIRIENPALIRTGWHPVQPLTASVGAYPNELVTIANRHQRLQIFRHIPRSSVFTISTVHHQTRNLPFPFFIEIYVIQRLIDINRIEQNVTCTLIVLFLS